MIICGNVQSVLIKGVWFSVGFSYDDEGDYESIEIEWITEGNERGFDLKSVMAKEKIEAIKSEIWIEDFD